MERKCEPGEAKDRFKRWFLVGAREYYKHRYCVLKWKINANLVTKQTGVSIADFLPELHFLRIALDLVLYRVQTYLSLSRIEMERKCKPNEANDLFNRKFLAGASLVEDRVNGWPTF